MYNSSRLLIIGSVPHKGKISTVGGTTILMDNLLSYLENKTFFKHIASNKFCFKGSAIFNTIYSLLCVLIYVPFSKTIMINSSSNGAFLFAPFVYIYSKLFSKKFIFRMFGGNLIDLINSKPKIVVSLFFKTVAKADLIFVETKALVKYMSVYNANVRWYPNVRKVDGENIARSKYNKRFVFIGHIKKSKGVAEIINAFKSIDDSYSIHIYGIIKDDVINNIKLPNNVNHKGSLLPDEVIRTLRKYDVLVLPTFHVGEGYPGIIIEAYSQGLPVITTKWKQIPEIVVNNKTGFLIGPKNKNELVIAIKSFTPENYSMLSANALSYFNNFNSEHVNAKILREIVNL